MKKKKKKIFVEMLKANGYDVKILNKNRRGKIKNSVQKQQENKKGHIHIF
jgi:uncharacterized protein (UPF0335 family)